MSERIWEDLAEMKKKLIEYVDKGRIVGHHEVREEPVIREKPDKSKIKPLKKVTECDVHFKAVDCSTRTLMRANNWGIYLFRAAHASVKGHHVDWGYEESMRTVVGDAYVRRRMLQEARLNLESEMALRLLRETKEGEYLLLDGASYFGGERKFWASLYEESEKRGVTLLTVSKQSPMLQDEKGRDLMAATYILSPYPIWVYYPTERRANIHEHQYGDVSMIKLCSESPRVFRCDIMEYLAHRDVHELLSPLTFISEDPRCLGYPVTLFLAHDFSAPSDPQLLYYHDQVEETLAKAGLLDVLRREALSASFADELHGVRYPFEWERIEHV